MMIRLQMDCKSDDDIVKRSRFIRATCRSSSFTIHNHFQEDSSLLSNCLSSLFQSIDISKTVSWLKHTLSSLSLRKICHINGSLSTGSSMTSIRDKGKEVYDFFFLPSI